MKINGLAYAQCGAAKSGAAQGAIRAAKVADVINIERLYKKVQVDESDIKRANLENFRQRGGMFEIPSRTTILSECLPKNRCFSLCKFGGKIEAIMRLSADLSEYEGLAPAGKNMLSYVELIVRSKYPHLVYPFLLANFNFLADAGYEALIFQIYHLLYVEKGECIFPLEIDNGASKGLNIKIGAKHIGELPQKTLKYGNTLLCIRPDVYILELSESLRRLEFLCGETHWRLY